MAKTYKREEQAIQRLYDIMSTNCIVAELGLKPVMFAGGVRGHVVVPHYGFFPLMSRANHSCTPSVTLVHPRSTSAGSVTTFVTTRDVKAGEALTMDYVNATPLSKKRLELYKGFGFRCRCERCRGLCALLECNEKGAKACGACHKVRYCCKEHQVKDWPRHKATECNVKQ
jgi:hypothetical protein